MVVWATPGCRISTTDRLQHAGRGHYRVIIRTGQNHIPMYGVYTVLLAVKSPNIRSYTVLAIMFETTMLLRKPR